MTAGIETLKILKSSGTYADLEKRTLFLTDGILQAAQKRGIPISINRATGLFTVFFTEGPVRDYPSAKRSDTRRFAQFFITMMERGVYLPPSQFEAWFVSTAHTRKDLEKTIAACDRAFRKI
jgi:glutamate-1-semialdehyde 2,1-aminomutase